MVSYGAGCRISIHALRMESDPNILQSSIYHCISIHALRMESDQWPLVPRLDLIHFYPRSPHGERPSGVYGSVQPLDFYPRSPHGERPLSQPMRTSDNIYFYPRSPHGERHPNRYTIISNRSFYPRSPHGERHPNRYTIISNRSFYPRSPHGERLFTNLHSSLRLVFLSTLSAWRATFPRAHLLSLQNISIHALRMESD